MNVSLIIPTLNEGEALDKVLPRIPKTSVDEIIVVDGRSTDRTREIAKAKGCKVVLQPNKGYGDALSHGVKKASGDVVIFMDADGSHPPSAISRLLDKLKQGYDIAWGSRYLEGASSDDDTFIRYIGNRLFTFLINKIHHVNVTDSLFIYTAMRKKAFEKINPVSADMEFSTELLIKARRKGVTIAEIPISEPKRIAGRSKLNAFYHGLRILYWIFIKKY